MSTQQFGNSDTQRKLVLIEKYLSAYANALKNIHFRLTYADVFAGTGSIEHRVDVKDAGFIDDETELLDAFSWGSAIRSLAVVPPFDSYLFADKSNQKLDNLRRTILDMHPDLFQRCRFEAADANEVLLRFCQTLDRNRDRVLVFLDPFGAQVEWATVKALGATQVVDLWYLFPTMAVQRMLPHRGEVPNAWARRLTLLFGDDDWRDVYYKKKQSNDLFDGLTETTSRSASIPLIHDHFRRKLEREFLGGVAKRTFPLISRNGTTMFLLFFAISNPKPAARNLALRLANDILKKA
ncbi:MAG: three-Cys-motif partner protein TcmP [Dongiaceae bacterium]